MPTGNGGGGSFVASGVFSGSGDSGGYSFNFSLPASGVIGSGVTSWTDPGAGCQRYSTCRDGAGGSGGWAPGGGQAGPGPGAIGGWGERGGNPVCGGAGAGAGGATNGCWPGP